VGPRHRVSTQPGDFVQVEPKGILDPVDSRARLEGQDLDQVVAGEIAGLRRVRGFEAEC
jgi:hypothetical protein